MNLATLHYDRVQLIDAYLADEKRRRRELDMALAEIDAYVEDETRARKPLRDQPVLVRRSLGARRNVYHSAIAPCGRTSRNGGKSAAFEEMPESQARLLDGGVLRPCPACWVIPGMPVLSRSAPS